MSSPEARIDFSAFWKEGETGVRPTSTTLNPEVIRILESANPGSYLDIGCGNGRLRLLLPPQHAFVGIDQDTTTINEANAQNYPNSEFAVASAEDIPFTDNTFDGTMLLGVLGSVDKETRTRIAREAVRVTKPGGIVYVAEFAMISDPEIRTTFGKRWIDVYRDDEPKTGEKGTVIVMNPDGSPRFLAHHFTQEKIQELAIGSGLENIELRKVEVVSTVSGLKRDNWNLWGNKPAVLPI